MLADILAQLQRKQAVEGKSAVAAAFELNWECLEPETQQLACLLSLFALTPIPWSLIESTASASNLEFDIKASCSVLIQRYILQKPAEDTYQIHERIRELLRLMLEQLPQGDELKHSFCQVMAVVAQGIPQSATQIEIARVSLAIPHIAEAATVYRDCLNSEDLIWPFVGLGRFYEGQGAYAQALPWREQCLSFARERLGENHPDVATSYNDLAVLYSYQGRYTETEPLFQKALELRQRLLGEEHPAVAQSYNNLAVLYSFQGRYTEAEPLFQKALALRQRLLGKEHPDVPTSYNPSKTILFPAANPKGTTPLRLDEKVREFNEGLLRAGQREQFVLETKRAVRLRSTQRAMLDLKPSIVHVPDHGTGDEDLVFEYRFSVTFGKLNEFTLFQPTKNQGSTPV